MHPLHRLSCLFLFASFLLLSFVIARTCFLACCVPRAARKRLVVVPPEEATIKAVVVSPDEPLMAVQVAELYSKPS